MLVKKSEKGYMWMRIIEGKGLYNFDLDYVV